MNCLDIVAILVEYKSKLSDVLGVDPGSLVIASQYSFIAATIDSKDIHIEFKIDEKSAKIYKFYCGDKSIEVEIRKKIEASTWPGLESTSTKISWSKDVVDYIRTADEVASLSVDCAAGDSYSPGNFSKVILSKDHIELQQINHMNAKSLDHKKNYSLRSLVFKIPVNVVGEMEVRFSDNSSENNKRCGDQIESELKRLSLIN